MWEKFRFASKEEAGPFYFEEKFRSTSKKDANLFYLKKKIRSASKKDVDPFYLKKNLDLHLRKMQIHFIWRKIEICI